MVYGAQAELIFSTAARRDAVLADMESFLTGKSKWGVDQLWAMTSKTGLPAIRCEVRFTARADADALLARVENFATGPRLPEPGSWIAIHNCSHDGAAAPCTPDSTRTW